MTKQKNKNEILPCEADLTHVFPSSGISDNVRRDLKQGLYFYHALEKKSKTKLMLTNVFKHM